MAVKSYGIENMSFRDSSRAQDYLLVRIPGAEEYHIPVNMAETSYMFPSELTEIICKDNLIERELDRYTAEEIENLAEDMKIEVQNYIKKAATKFVDEAPKDDDGTLLIKADSLVFTNLDK